MKSCQFEINIGFLLDKFVNNCILHGLLEYNYYNHVLSAHESDSSKQLAIISLIYVIITSNHDNLS